MRWPVGFIAVALLASPAAAGPLDDAVSLVLANHPLLAARRAEVRAQAEQRSWSSAATLSWTERGTEFGRPGGPNAGVTLRIPLFDRTRGLRIAQANTKVAETQDKILSAFLADVERLRGLYDKMREAKALRKFHRDKARYWRKQVEQGAEEPSALWPHAEKFKRAEQVYRQASSKAELARETIARKYGGEQWKRLSDLLAAIVK